MKITSHPEKPDDRTVVEVLIRGVGWQQVNHGSFEVNSLFAHWIDPNKGTLRTVSLSEIVGYARESDVEDFTP
jgi:hypothetical protein